MTLRRQRRALHDRWQRIRRSAKWEPIAEFWVAVVSVVLLREAFRYSGWAAKLAEWEYATFGRHLPVLSLLLLIASFGAPALVVMWLVRRRERRQRYAHWAHGEQDKSAKSLIRTESIVLRLLLGCASVATLVALVALALAFRLPTATDRPQQLDARVAGAPHVGPATLAGAVLYRRTATFQQNIFLFNRTVQFAPVVDPRDPATVRYLAEVTPERLDALNGGRDNPPFVGVLRENALPGAVLRLFRYAGFRVDPPYYVLFASATTMRWPFYTVAINAGLVALFTTLLALFQRRRVRQVEDHARTLVAV